MMSNDDYNHFNTIVAGNKPSELMMPYDSKKEVEPYVVMKMKDCDKIYQTYIKTYESILKSQDLSKEEREEYAKEYNEIKGKTPEQFFYSLSLGREMDEMTGDIISRKNKFGKWSYFSLAKNFAIPFKLKDGSETYQAKKGDIDWSLMHMANTEVYKRAWEMVMENSKPEGEMEETIYENMKNRTAYFLKFETKENYIKSSCAFWSYAFLSETTGWQQLEDNMNQFVWVSNFYDLYIKNLPDDTLLTIYECIK